MSFSPDLANQPQKVIFSRKTTKKIYPKIFSMILQLGKSIFKIIWTWHLDSKFSFDIQIKTILTKVNRTIGLL